MATSIEWTRGDDGRPGETWNPVTGCTKVSQGCKHCYAERDFRRPYPGRDFTDVRVHPDRLDRPLRWKRQRRVFVNSMSDLFHEDVPNVFIAHVFAVMGQAPQHQFKILTKRPARMKRLLEGDLFFTERASGKPRHVSFLPNVWLGVSVENQETADERIPMLLQTPAAVRFISAEPLLGDVRLGAWLQRSPSAAFTAGKVTNDMPAWTRLGSTALDWVIVGGESGPHARPCHVDWIRSVVLQCQAAQVPVFVKQLGARPCEEGCEPGHVWIGDGPKVLRKIVDRKGADVREWPDDLCVQEFPEC